MSKAKSNETKSTKAAKKNSNGANSEGKNSASKAPEGATATKVKASNKSVKLITREVASGSIILRTGLKKFKGIRSITDSFVRWTVSADEYAILKNSPLLKNMKVIVDASE